MSAGSTRPTTTLAARKTRSTLPASAARCVAFSRGSSEAVSWMKGRDEFRGERQTCVGSLGVVTDRFHRRTNGGKLPRFDYDNRRHQEYNSAFTRCGQRAYLDR